MSFPRPEPDPADILAIVPSILGFVPTEHLVVVPVPEEYSARDFVTALPFDLPQSGSPAAYRQFSSTVAGSVARDRRVRRALVAIYTSAVAGGITDRPHADLQDQVIRKLHARGVHLLESMYVASNGWGSYLCDDGRCLHSGPLPLRELRERAEYLAWQKQRSGNRDRETEIRP